LDIDGCFLSKIVIGVSNISQNIFVSFLEKIMSHTLYFVQALFFSTIDNSDDIFSISTGLYLSMNSSTLSNFFASSNNFTSSGVAPPPIARPSAPSIRLPLGSSIRFFCLKSFTSRVSSAPSRELIPCVLAFIFLRLSSALFTKFLDLPITLANSPITLGLAVSSNGIIDAQTPPATTHPPITLGNITHCNHFGTISLSADPDIDADISIPLSSSSLLSISFLIERLSRIVC
jgi:hypothetical protein